METLIIAFAVYAIWQMTGGFSLSQPARAIIAAICIAIEVIVILLATGLAAHLH